MLSLEAANAYLEMAASDLKELSYDELESFARSHCMFDNWQSRESLVEGEKVEVNTMICKLGRLHKRISVEMTLSVEGEGEGDALSYPFIYFERFKSGRLYPSPREEAREAALFKALPYAFFGGVVLGLLALVWHLFLRGG